MRNFTWEARERRHHALRLCIEPLEARRGWKVTMTRRFEPDLPKGQASQGQTGGGEDDENGAGKAESACLCGPGSRD